MSRPTWQEFLKKPEVQELLVRGADALEEGTLEERARQKRLQLAQSFGLHAQITDASVSTEGDVRLRIAFDQDIAFVPDDLKELVVNGVPLSGAQIVEVRRNQGGRPAVEMVISVNVERDAIPALRQRPLSVCVLTKEDVRLKAIKMV